MEELQLADSPSTIAESCAATNEGNACGLSHAGSSLSLAEVAGAANDEDEADGDDAVPAFAVEATAAEWAALRALKEELQADGLASVQGALVPGECWTRACCGS